MKMRRWMNNIAWPWGWVALALASIFISAMAFLIVTWPESIR